MSRGHGGMVTVTGSALRMMTVGPGGVGTDPVMSVDTVLCVRTLDGLPMRRGAGSFRRGMVDLGGIQ